MKVIRTKFYVVDLGDVNKAVNENDIFILELPYNEEQTDEENVKTVTEQISDRLSEGKVLPVITSSGKICLLNSNAINGLVVDSIVAGSYKDEKETK